jgi:hypothetical protein
MIKVHETNCDSTAEMKQDGQPYAFFTLSHFFMRKNDRIELDRVLFSDKMSTLPYTNKLLKPMRKDHDDISYGAIHNP